MNELYEQPERDQFRTESPIRAFTTFDVHGGYALGKGFRPSLQHLTQYLDAMERIERWRLLQILEATSGSPSFMFRRHEPALYNVTVPGPPPSAEAFDMHPMVGGVPIADDPVNPKHYDGTACAEIIENLPGNLAHAFTYIWRAGDKPNQPEAQELHKAVWFLERELRLALVNAEEEDEETDDIYDYLPGQKGLLHWSHTHVKRRRSDTISDHMFYKFAVDERIAKADIPEWRKSTLTMLVVYAIDRKPAPVANAIESLKWRICRTAPDNCPEFGRQQEP